MATSDPALLSSIVDILWSTRPKRILDIGCGFGKVGFLSREYLDIYLNHAYHRSEWSTIVDGVEIFSDFITPVHEYLYNQIHIGDITDLLSSLGYYDVIFMLDVIEHLPKDVGQTLLRNLRKHAREIVVSTPSSPSEQGEVFSNVHERHLSSWEPRDFNAYEMSSRGSVSLYRIKGISDRVHLVCEALPGWSIGPLTSDLATFLRSQGLEVNLYDWESQESLAQVVEVARDLSERIYVATAHSAEVIANYWGVPRDQLYSLCHSDGDVELATQIGNQYAGVGYINLRQGDRLREAGIDAVYVPQYVDVQRFTPSVWEGPLRVGAVLSTTAFPQCKGVPLLSEIVRAINERDDMIFDSRAVVGPMGNKGLRYNEMSEYYHDIDVLLVTSSSEGGPLPPLQAGASGVLTISTRCGHMPDFIQDGVTGFLVDSDVESFMACLYQLTDKIRLTEMGSAVREHTVDKWSVESCCPLWLTLLERLR